VDAAGANQIAVATGANAQLRAAHVPDKDLQPGTTLVLQGEVDPAESAALIRRARTQGARIVLNLAPAGPFEADALAMVDWLVVNEAEAAALSRQLGISADAPSLRSALNVGVVCTKGRLGVELAAAGAVLSLASLQVDVVDSTAAGDCLTGVFAAALDRGMAAENALRRANVAAAACCNRRGSQSSLPDKAEIDAKVKAYNPFATV
jgi:ribokinase